MRVLLFAAATTAATTVIFGLLPAWQASGASPASTMRAESGSIAGGRHVTLRKLFVGLQVGLSAMLLIAAGLFIRTLRNLHHADLGLKPDHVVMFTVRPAAPYGAERKSQVYRALMDGLARTPGVSAVGANRSTLFTGGRSDGSVSIPGLPESKEADSFFNWVTPGYFDALGIPVKAGRDFSWRDWGSGRKLALVDERVVKEYFGGSPPIGRSMGFGMRAPYDTEIVGVFADARYHDVRCEVPRQVFTNLDSVMERVSSITVYARAAGDPRAVMPALRQAVAAVDAGLVINDMRTLDDQLNLRLANERLTSSLSGGFALLATILALVGLHGVLAFVVERRTREIGVRIALGATRGRIAGMISGEMGIFIAVGLAAGAAAGYFLGAAVESQLFGVRAADPLVIGTALALLLGAAAAATLIPAWRACRIQPVRALRYE
jgi:predicted permease